MSSKHLTFRVSLQVYEEIKSRKPDGIKMSAFIAQLVDKALEKPQTTYETLAAKELQINRAVNMRTHDEMVAIENDKAQDAFHLSQGHITFSEIVEKHKVELEKKYG